MTGRRQVYDGEASRLAPDVVRPTIKRGTPKAVKDLILSAWDAAVQRRAADVAAGHLALHAAGFQVLRTEVQTCPECGEDGDHRGSTNRCRTKGNHAADAPSAAPEGSVSVTSIPIVPQVELHDCGAPVLVVEGSKGGRAPQWPWSTLVDPFRLDEAGEVAAIVARRATYNLWGSPGAYTIDPRFTPGAQAGTFIVPRPAPQRLVVAEHVCGQPALGTGRLPLVPNRWAPTGPDGDEIPF